MTRWAAALAAAVALAAAGAGCGGSAGDLFELKRTGRGAGAALTLVVSASGQARCDGGPPRPLGGDRLLQARALARDLRPLASRGLRLPPDRHTTFSYAVRLPEGGVRWSDTSPRQPRPLPAAAAFARDAAKRVCGRAR